MRIAWLALAAVLLGGEEEKPKQKTPADFLKEELASQGTILYDRYMDNRVWDIGIMNADGSAARNLSATGDIHEHLPCATADGRRIFYVRIPSIVSRERLLPFRNYAHLPWEWEGHLWMTDPDGKKHEPLTFLQLGHYAPVEECTGPTVLNDEAVVYGEPWTQRIFVHDLKSGVRKGYPTVGQARQIAVAPDGKSLWYAAPGYKWLLYRMDLETGRNEQMGGGDFLWPAVSRDGTKVAHVVANRLDLTGGLKEWCIVVRDAADGRNLRFLLGAKGENLACPAWGPDDRYLAYNVRGGETPWSLRVTRLADKVTAAITTSSQGYRMNPFWIPPANPASRPATQPR